MLKRWTALLLAVMLIFLTACSAQKEYKLSAVFAAAEEDRPQWLADPDNAALWEQLGLSGSVVSDGAPAALTIGAQNWVLQPATVEGRSVTLCYCVDEQNRPLLDLRASFGINVLPVEEWTACEDLFIVRVWARQGGDLPENYLSGEDEGLNRYAVLLTDPITGESASAVASDAELQALLADGEPRSHTAVPCRCPCPVPAAAGHAAGGAVPPGRHSAVPGLAGKGIGAAGTVGAAPVGRPPRGK